MRLTATLSVQALWLQDIEAYHSNVEPVGESAKCIKAPVFRMIAGKQGLFGAGRASGI